MNDTRVDVAMPTSSKILCTVYAVIVLAALIATLSQNLAYAHSLADLTTFIGSFVTDTKVNPASRSITADILLFFLAAAIFMVIEARKHDVKFVWAYLIGGGLIAISVTFPLFLIARERRTCRTDPTRLTATDTAVLALFAVGIAALVIWVDVV